MYLGTGMLLHNRYKIESLLGHGGFGITYAAHDKVLNVRVAIKEYLPRQLATRGEGQTQVSIFTGEARQQYEHGLRKFLEEAQSVARFSHHPNIVSARDYFEAHGTAYMVMEYVEGVTLKEYLEKKGGKISFDEAKAIMLPVLDALREVHQAGLLHRDISPDNIYITSSAQVKLLDFGAARYFAGEQSKSLSVILKQGYAPEEQYRSSGKQGAWTDIYAGAATMYRAITGQTPPEALDRLAEDTLVPPSRLGVAIPPAMEQGLLRGLAVRAGQRFQTMGEFQQALQADATVTGAYQPVSPTFPPGPGPVEAPPPGAGGAPEHYTPRRRRSFAPAAIAAGVVIAFLLGGGLYLQGTRQAPPQSPAPAPQGEVQTPPEAPQPEPPPAVADRQGPQFPELPPPPAPEPARQFPVGNKWLINWQSQYQYRGYLHVRQQLAANRYSGRIAVTFINPKNVKVFVSMDCVLTVRGQEVMIACSNPSESWWDTDDFYLEWHNGTMTGYNLDKKGRRGKAVFTLVDEARLANFLREVFQPQVAPPSPPPMAAGVPGQGDQGQIQQVIREYYGRVAQRNVDGAISMYATARIPAIKRHIIEAVARATESYRFASINVYQNNGQEAKAQVQLLHKKYNQPEEKWVIDINMVKEAGVWKIWSTPGKRVS
jgi:serine/threonine protein kinase